jgi:hypothetical protein
MNEVVIVPCYLRPELLYCCLKRIRECQPKIPIHLFPDRGTWPDHHIQKMQLWFDAEIHRVADHDLYGNTYNTFEAFKWAWHAGYEYIYLIESDVIVHHDFFAWHRKMHEEYDEEGLFASMGWIFNRHAPIVDGEMFQHWYYSIGVCFQRERLASVIQHATPSYYCDMAGYVRTHFKDSPLNDPQNIAHFEQDGLVQRILDREKMQTVSPGIAKCSHMGFVRSYGDEGAGRGYEDLFDGRTDFMERVERIEQLIADPYERISFFGKDIVERELGREIENRVFKYRLSLPGGWSTEFESPLEVRKLPRRLASVDIPHDARIELVIP